MNYNTKLLCTYDKHETDISDDIYRSQLLQIFNMECFDEKIINKRTNDLYDFLYINHPKHLEKIMTSIKNNENLNLYCMLFENKDKNIFRLLFMFDLFNLTHRLFCSLINENFNQIFLDNLINKINNL